MIDYSIEHHIQKYIMSKLYRQQIARFSELKKPGVDTNLFSYHLKILTQEKFVKKIEGGYTLDSEGLRYVDRISELNMNIRLQPKIITMLILQNSDGEILLQKRMKQPYIDLWTLPYGKLHVDDISIEAAALREASEKVNLNDVKLIHAGDCYIRVPSDDKNITSTLVHIFKCEVDDVKQKENQIWVHPRGLHKYNLAPAVEKIIVRTFFNDVHFFEEFSEELVRD
jgi:ADP-ribose pyrophosphatase YjhB (NUDIX family)